MASIQQNTSLALTVVPTQGTNSGMVPFETFPKEIDRVIGSFFSTIILDQTPALKEVNGKLQKAKGAVRFKQLFTEEARRKSDYESSTELGELLQDLTNMKALIREDCTFQASQLNILYQYEIHIPYEVVARSKLEYACVNWCGEDVLDKIITEDSNRFGEDYIKKELSKAFVEVCKEGSIAGIEAIAKKLGQKVTDSLNEGLYRAAAHNTAKVCEYLIRRLMADVNAKVLDTNAKVYDRTLLFAACTAKIDDMRDDKEIIRRAKVFISAPNAKLDGNPGETGPLHWVSSAEIAQALVDGRANVNAVDNSGQTPLHLLFRRVPLPSQWREIAKILIRAGIRTDAKDNYGFTALDAATGKHRAELEELIKLTTPQG